MNTTPRTSRPLARLDLGFEVLHSPDWPVLTIKVDGVDRFAAVASDWRGFDPGQMLGPLSPLVPEPFGRRVALCRCSCGEAGCGVMAPLIVESPDGRTISWLDFRDYVGVFDGPNVAEAVDSDGREWGLPDIHFDRDQYLAEVGRASSDRSWETPQRRVARLVFERVQPMGLVLPPHLALAWTAPAASGAGVDVMFEHGSREPRPRFEQRRLRLASSHSDPDDAAEDMVEQLLSVAPEDWVRTFGRPIG